MTRELVNSKFDTVAREIVDRGAGNLLPWDFDQPVSFRSRHLLADLIADALEEAAAESREETIDDYRYEIDAGSR